MLSAAQETSCFCRALFLVFLAVSPSVGADGASPELLEAGDTLRGHGERIVRVETETAGLLTLDLVIPVAAPVDGRLVLDDPDALARTAHHALLVSPGPGGRTLRIAPQDPRRQLGAWRLRTGFTPLSDLALGKTEEMEVDPDPFTVGGCGPLQGKPMPPEPTPAEPFLGTACVLDPLDDHGDTPACATPFVGPRIEGQLHNGWGDDADVFTFTLREWQTVILEALGPSDLVGALYEADGMRLAVDGHGELDGFRWVKTLAPGRYFVRIEGSPGAYELGLGTGRP